jgi:hypothetical protein
MSTFSFVVALAAICAFVHVHFLMSEQAADLSEAFVQINQLELVVAEQDHTLTREKGFRSDMMKALIKLDKDMMILDEAVATCCARGSNTIHHEHNVADGHRRMETQNIPTTGSGINLQNDEAYLFMGANQDVSFARTNDGGMEINSGAVAINSDLFVGGKLLLKNVSGVDVQASIDSLGGDLSDTVDSLVLLEARAYNLEVGLARNHTVLDQLVKEVAVLRQVACTGLTERQQQIKICLMFAGTLNPNTSFPRFQPD